MDATQWQTERDMCAEMMRVTTRAIRGLTDDDPMFIQADSWWWAARARIAALHSDAGMALFCGQIVWESERRELRKTIASLRLAQPSLNAPASLNADSMHAKAVG